MKTLFLKLQGFAREAQIGSKMGSEWHLRRGGPQKASGESLGALLEASGDEKKKLGMALGRLGPQKSPKIGAQIRQKPL